MSEILAQTATTKSSIRSMTGQSAGNVEDEIGTVSVKRGSIQASARYVLSHAVPPGSIDGAAVVAYAFQYYFRDTLSIFSCIDCSRSVRVPTLILVVIRGAPIA